MELREKPHAEVKKDYFFREMRTAPQRASAPRTGSAPGSDVVGRGAGAVGTGAGGDVGAAVGCTGAAVGAMVGDVPGVRVISSSLTWPGWRVTSFV